VQLGKRDAFNVLRTQEQLGYIVSMFLSQELGVHGVAFVVQSDKHAAGHLGARVEAFVRQLVARLDDIPEVRQIWAGVGGRLVALLRVLCRGGGGERVALSCVCGVGGSRGAG